MNTRNLGFDFSYEHQEGFVFFFSDVALLFEALAGGLKCFYIPKESGRNYQKSMYSI